MRKVERRTWTLVGVGLLLAIFLAATLTLPVRADDISGTCGENLTWVVENGTLTIFGTGPMEDYTYDSMPWYQYRESITAVVIEQGVTSIGKDAFYGCTGLTDISIPDSVVEIKGYSFIRCDSLRSITIPESVTSIGDSAFSRSGLVSVVIPKSVTVLPDELFEDCTYLESVTLPDTLTAIHFGAFNYCESLTEIRIPASVTWIGADLSEGELSSNVFSGCTSLKRILVDENNPNYCSDTQCALYNKNKTVLITVPGATEGVFEIPEGVEDCSFAFDGCEVVTGVVFPASLKYVDEWVFSDCYELTTVYISDIRSWCEIGSKWSESWGIGGGCQLYLNGKELSGELVIPEGTTRIGKVSFENCTQITSVKFPSTLKVIDKWAFLWCEGITELEIPGSVEEIRYQAFCGCKALKKVTIGEGIKEISSTFFWNCDELETVIFKGDAPEFAEDAFRLNTFTAYYPYGNTTWTEQVMQDYGGTVNWVPYYPVLSGENSKVNADTEEDLPIRVDADVSGFVNVLMDGQPVEPSNYTVTSGSTVVTFRAEYLRQLDVGEHTVTLVFADAQALATLTITDGIPGDMDADGMVKDADAVYLLRYTLFPESYPLNGDGDINCDGSVTDADAVYLLRYTLFPEEYPLYPGK